MKHVRTPRGGPPCPPPDCADPGRGSSHSTPMWPFTLQWGHVVRERRHFMQLHPRLRNLHYSPLLSIHIRPLPDSFRTSNFWTQHAEKRSAALVAQVDHTRPLRPPTAGVVSAAGPCAVALAAPTSFGSAASSIASVASSSSRRRASTRSLLRTRRRHQSGGACF